MSTASFQIFAPSSTDLASRIDAEIDAVRNSYGQGASHRVEAIRLVHRWVAQQDRTDVLRTVRYMDAWVTKLNSACSSTSSVRPVVRVGLRLRTAGF